MNCLVLVVDRLHAGYLGCYGNTWIATPAFNRLAAEGAIFDTALLDSPQLADVYRALWSGRHIADRESPSAAATEPQFDLPARLLAAGRQFTLLTDDPDVGRELPSVVGGERIEVPVTLVETPVDDVDETHLARLFATAVDWLTARSARPGEPFCLWMHTGALGQLWDAPLEIRNRYADEDEAPAADIVLPPQIEFSEDYDPDALLAICQAYAGQVTVLDACLGSLWELLLTTGLLDNTLVVVTSARGLALGAQRRVGCWDTHLTNELVQLPLMVRWPDRQAAATRWSSIVQLPDVASTLADALGVEPFTSTSLLSGQSLLALVRGERLAWRDRALVCGSTGAFGLRTPAWYLRAAGGLAGTDAPAETALFAKPDDRWDVNDIALRCPDIVDQLLAVSRATLAASQQRESSELAPLATNLTSPWR